MLKKLRQMKVEKRLTTSFIYVVMITGIAAVLAMILMLLLAMSVMACGKKESGDENETKGTQKGFAIQIDGVTIRLGEQAEKALFFKDRAITSGLLDIMEKFFMRTLRQKLSTNSINTRQILQPGTLTCKTPLWKNTVSSFCL